MTKLEPRSGLGMNISHRISGQVITQRNGSNESYPKKWL